MRDSADPLAELADAVRAGTLLAWAVKYAPDGDAEAAVARAWRGCRDCPDLLVFVLAAYGSDSREYRGGISVAAQFGWVGGGATTCDVVRHAVAAPTFAALLARSRGAR